MSHLDRTGEEILEVPDEWPAIPEHDPRCDGHGWIDRDATPAIPCLASTANPTSAPPNSTAKPSAPNRRPTDDRTQRPVDARHPSAGVFTRGARERLRAAQPGGRNGRCCADVVP